MCYSGVNPVSICAVMCFELSRTQSTPWGATVPLLNQLKKNRSSGWGRGVAAIKQSYKHPWADVDCPSEAFSWQLSAKSPSETQERDKERERQDRLQVLIILETGNTDGEQHGCTN